MTRLTQIFFLFKYLSYFHYMYVFVRGTLRRQRCWVTQSWSHRRLWDAGNWTLKVCALSHWAIFSSQHKALNTGSAMQHREPVTGPWRGLWIVIIQGWESFMGDARMDPPLLGWLVDWSTEWLVTILTVVVLLCSSRSRSGISGVGCSSKGVSVCVGTC